MSADVIKEFLVALGYKDDEAGHRRFNDAIEKTSKGIVGLGLGIEAAMVGLYAYLNKAAEGFERLGYQASLMGSTVQSLRDAGYAASQTGSSYDALLKSAQALSNYITAYGPGARAKFQGLVGVDILDAKGKLKDMVALDQELDAALKKKYPGAKGSLGYTMVRKIEDEYGTPEDLSRAFSDPQFAQRSEENAARNKSFGIDDKTVADAKEFEQSIRELKADFDAIELSLAGRLWKDFGIDLKDFDTWLKDHHKEIEDILVDISKGLLEFGKGIISVIKPIGEFIDKQIGWKLAGEIFASVILLKMVAPLDVLIARLTLLAAWRLPVWLATMLGIPAGGIFATGAAGLALGAAIMPQAAGQGEDERARQQGMAGGGIELDHGGAAAQHSQFERDHPILTIPTRAWRQHAPAWLGGSKNAHLLRGHPHAAEPVTTGGEGAGAGAGNTTGGGKPNANFTADNAQSVKESAARLGTTPEDLATVINYETGGTFSPSKWGGAGGRYMGLIQFGPPEREKYGANENQTFREQMGSVEKYLTDRGFKPGMSREDLYSTILTGHPGHPDKRDSGGYVWEHVERMSHGRNAARTNMFLNSGQPDTSVPASASTAPAATDEYNNSPIVHHRDGSITQGDYTFRPGHAHPAVEKAHDVLERMRKALIKKSDDAKPSLSNQPAINLRPPDVKAPPLGQHSSWHRPSNQIAMNQKTDIHVHGADNPQETAQRVGRHQTRVNSDLLKNTAGAIG